MAKATQFTLKWRVVDMVTAAVLGVACGVIFVIWNQIGYAAFSALDALTPGVGGLVSGIWFMGGPLGMLIIRKPGAAIFVETVAAIVSMAIGSQWGLETVLSGFIQGLGAELIFALFLYRSFGVLTAALSGAGAGLAAMVLELFTSGNLAKGFLFNGIYWSCSIISGIVLAGLLSWALTRALAKTGVLDRFASGRELRARI
ncbi:hypothetical protein FYJ24_06635 [Actinomycetaceae bacterium WB03_NA08]|uniref:Energy-coupling factor transport system substrate-specific component n=1 Tax=Scrofimicrobium canadense TaxID=2652290 RepID=A0A6N7W7H0_9ACTO|nr:ECF transporter S component [Scrofimicrobium canadense]MSS84443.1 hypothetical protein [Scrofimicrobium canadense]